MRAEPADKRTIAFIDGQNLFYAAKLAFGRGFPDYDPRALAAVLCEQRGWSLICTRFYTGVPGAAENPRWHVFWKNKLEAMRRAHVQTYWRPLRYRDVSMPDGSVRSVGQE